MISPNKAIHLDQEDQHDALSERNRLSTTANSRLYPKSQSPQSLTPNHCTFKVFLMVIFLIVCVCLLTVRYMELCQNDDHPQIGIHSTQTYNEQIARQPSANIQGQHSLERQSTDLKIEDLHQNQYLTLQNSPLSLSDHYGLLPSQKLSVLQDTESDENSPQLKTQSQDLLVDMTESGNVQIDSDEGSLDVQNDDSSNEDLHQNGVKSIEQAELLNARDNQKVDQMQAISHAQFQLHSNAQNQNQQLHEQQNEYQSKLNTQLNQDIAEPNDQSASQHKDPLQAKSQLQLSEQDLYDPIIRVKDKMQEKFKTKFEDLIYIKTGTNVSEAQYYKARQRMSIWKFFNPSTGNLELLQGVAYEPEVTSTPLSVQQSIDKIKKVIKQQRQEYEQKYRVSDYQEIRFCVIIPSYKNQDKYLRNLNSILQQDYQNYHIIYIDDASQDGTAQKVKAYIQKYNISSNRLQFIQNPVNKKALPNIDYAARRLCKSGQIMAIIDGDDYLIGTQVFRLINARYQQENLLALYTNHLRVHEPIYLKVGTCIDYPERVKKARAYRRFSIFPASHLRTFYVDLYWRINVRDLKDYKGQYFTAANDFAIMMPILQMAGDNFEYLPELTYVYDAGTGFNNFQTKADTQAKNFKITKRRHRYPKLARNIDFQNRFQDPNEINAFNSGLSSEIELSPGQKLRQRINNS